MTSPIGNAGLSFQPEPEAAKNVSPVPRLSLVPYPDTILRTVGQPVTTFDSALRDLAEGMLSLLHQGRGFGLAAPQVGRRQRLIVCDIQHHSFCLTNPEVKDAAEPRDGLESCLSLPGVQVTVRRPERIRVTGYDLLGQRRSFGATGLWARVIQHELDHLNGVLICDYHHPEVDKCSHCPLELPAVLVEERKRQSRPEASRCPHNPQEKIA
jgi:peptide deformylase